MKKSVRFYFGTFWQQIPRSIAQNRQTFHRRNSPSRARQLHWEQVTTSPESIDTDRSSVAVTTLRSVYPTATKRKSTIDVAFSKRLNRWHNACRPKVSWWARLELFVAIVNIPLDNDRGWVRSAIAGETIWLHARTIAPQSRTPSHPGWFWIADVIEAIDVNDIY